MSTTTSRISPNLVANFYQDNTGRTIDQQYLSFTATGGTVSIAPYKQMTYINFTESLTSNLVLSFDATASMICDKVTVMVKGGSTTYSVSYDGDITAGAASVNVPASKYAVYEGTFNGTKFIGTNTVQI